MGYYSAFAFTLDRLSSALLSSQSPGSFIHLPRPAAHIVLVLIFYSNTSALCAIYTALSLADHPTTNTGYNSTGSHSIPFSIVDSTSDLPSSNEGVAQRASLLPVVSQIAVRILTFLSPTSRLT